MTIEQQRQAVITEALTWMWTPFRWHAAIKGQDGGVDCGCFLREVFKVVGIEVDLPQYYTQFFLNDNEEIYLNTIRRYCVDVESPLIGDIVAYNMGKAFGHAGIVKKWPRIIHVLSGGEIGVQEIDAEMSPELNFRAKRFFSPKQWHSE